MDSDSHFTSIRWEGSAMEWRKIIGSRFCNLPPGHKHVLTVMARYGDKWGDDIFPSQREIAFRAGVTPKCVTHVMQKAEKKGWIARYAAGARQGYKRHLYELAVPNGLEIVTTGIKTQFWKPPYSYRLIERDGEYFLEDRETT